ncbi:MAG: T9SS type A sorting domain-containing protein [Bacteroidota bacterium]|nr:T9SS type A sorting domain-containing protein [Bacteroidota bacterium]
MYKRVLPPVILSIVSLLFATSGYAQLFLSPPKQLSPADLFDAEGVSILINPINPLQLAAGSDVNYFYYSSDQGQSWNGNGLNTSFGDPGDPSLAADSKGNIYYSHLSDNLDRIVVQKSTNGGSKYSDGTFVGLSHSPRAQFKEWIVSDLSSTSPHKDALYLSWTEFDAYKTSQPRFDSSRILFSSSVDQGATWSTPIVVSDSDGDCADSSNTVEGARCTTGPNGEIYITWCGPSGLLFDKSTDGGKTFGKDKILSAITPGWLFNVSGIYRCNAFATPICDISSRKTRGNLYVVFSDKRNGENNSDVFLLRSTDGGSSWSVPLRVNDDTTQTEQFFPSAAIDQTTGFIYCLFYDRRDHIGRNLTEVYLARSIDGGLSFQNFRLNSNRFNPSNKIYLGDYTHIAASNTYVYPAWTEEKSNNDGITFSESIWTAIVIDTGALRAAVTEPASPNQADLSVSLSPNPTHTQLHITVNRSAELHGSLEIRDVMGRSVMAVPMTSESMTMDVSHWASGVYYCIVECGDERAVQKFIVGQ